MCSDRLIEAVLASDSASIDANDDTAPLYSVPTEGELELAREKREAKLHTGTCTGDLHMAETIATC